MSSRISITPNIFLTNSSSSFSCWLRFFFSFIFSEFCDENFSLLFSNCASDQVIDFSAVANEVSIDRSILFSSIKSSLNLISKRSCVVFSAFFKYLRTLNSPFPWSISWMFCSRIDLVDNIFLCVDWKDFSASCLFFFRFFCAVLSYSKSSSNCFSIELNCRRFLSCSFFSCTKFILAW